MQGGSLKARTKSLGLSIFNNTECFQAVPELLLPLKKEINTLDSSAAR